MIKLGVSYNSSYFNKHVTIINDVLFTEFNKFMSDNEGNKIFDKAPRYAMIQWFCNEYGHEFVGFIQYDNYSDDNSDEDLLISQNWNTILYAFCKKFKIRDIKRFGYYTELDVICNRLEERKKVFSWVIDGLGITGFKLSDIEHLEWSWIKENYNVD